MKSQQQFDLSGKKLFIAIPAYDFKVSIKMLGSLIQFSQQTSQHGIGFELGTISGCSVVSRARNLLVSDFLASSCESLLFIDSDMSVDPNDILRLFALNQKRDIVGGVGCARKFPATYYSKMDKDADGNIVMDTMGLVRAESLGTGFMCIHRNVIEALVAAHPEWEYFDATANRKLHSVFDFKSTPEGYIGEDYLFCERAREIGFTVWIDPTIKLGHFGVHEYDGDFGNDVLYPMVKAAQIKAEEEPLMVAYG